MFKQIKLIFSFYRDEYRKHLLKSRVSYLINYYELRISSFLNKKNKLVAISLIEHIGDLIANEPLSREIRKKHPTSTIIWFVRKPYKELLKYNPNIDKVFTVYCLTTWIKIRDKIKFEAVYDLHFNGRSCNTCYCPLIKENTDDSINGTNYFNFGGLLKAVSLHNKIEASDTTPLVYIPSGIINKGKIYNQREDYIVVHCSSNELIKDWEDCKWNDLAQKIIADYKYHVIEIGMNNKIKIDSDFYHDLCGKLSILESAEVIKNAKLFIGIDSGPAHMANATGTPGLVLFGEYYFGMKNYNPFSGNYGLSKRCRLVYSDNLVKDISVENVIENFHSLLKEIT